MKTIYYDIFDNDDNTYLYAYTDKGICFIGSPNHDIDEMNSFIKADNLIKKENTDIEKELKNYLSGKLKQFNLSIDLSWSTPFQKKVYAKLQTVKYGQTIDYSYLSTLLNKPTATRAVASAVAKNPVLFLIPCHRVLRKDGSLGGFRAGLEFKKELLLLESK